MPSIYGRSPAHAEPSNPGGSLPAGVPASRRDVLIVVALTLAIALVFALLAAPNFRFTGDTQLYVGLAQSLVRGEGYSFDGHPHLLYPPGLSLLLAPVAWASHESFAAMSRWAAMLASLVFPLTWLWVRRHEPRLALPIAILTVFSLNFLSYATDNPGSESLYLAASLGLLAWGDRVVRPSAGSIRWKQVLLGSALCIVVPAVRMIGLAGVVASGLMLLWAPWEPPSRRRILIATYGIPCLVGLLFVLAWFLRARLLAWEWYPGAGSYDYSRFLLFIDPHHPDLGRVSIWQFLGRIWGRLLAQGVHLGEVLAPVPWLKVAWYSPVLLATATIVAGWWTALRGAGRFGALYLVCYVGIVALWPYDEGPRFMVPVAPLLWLYFWYGLRKVHEAVLAHRSWPRLILLAWCVAVIPGIVLGVGGHLAGLSRQDWAALAFALLALAGVVLPWEALTRRIRRMEGWQLRTMGGMLVAAFALAAVIQSAPIMLDRARGNLPRSESALALMEASQWIANNTRPGDVIQTTFTSRIEFSTGRQAIPFPVTESPEPFLIMERQYHPRYLIVLDSEDPYHTPIETVRFELMQRLFPDHWQLRHRFTGGSIYATR